MIDDVGTSALRDEIEVLEVALDGAISHACHYKRALEELEAESRRPFATIEHIGFLARRALDT